MKKTYLFLLLFLGSIFQSYADRIYIMNSPGWQTITPALVAAIAANGHTVDQNPAGVYTLPAGFTTRCDDPVNGYDWLCFFGNNNFLFMLPQIQAYIDLGGKIFYQYEVGCCTVSSDAAAAIASGLTGLTITPNSNSAIASSSQGWEATNVNCCATIMGGAYKGMDGLPLANQLQATANLGGSTPSITACSNFGFVFTTTDFVGTAHKGGMIGLGDFNTWFNGLAAPSSPIYYPMVNFIFPNDTTTCYIFPPGCLNTYSTSGSVGFNVNIGNDTTICPGQTLTLNAFHTGATYLWQNGSTNATYNVTTPGTYWVQVTMPCGQATDTIIVSNGIPPQIHIGNDTTICQGIAITLNATSTGATYLWQNGSTNPTQLVTTSGTYWVQVTTSCGLSSDTIQISTNIPPIVNLGNDTSICDGNFILLDAGSPTLTHLWQNGSTSATQYVTTSGTYWVKVGSGCITTDSIQVNVITLPYVDLGPDVAICYGDSITFNGYYPGATYTWQDGSSNSKFTANSTGLYWVDVKVGNCVARDSVIVQEGGYINVELGSNKELCDGETFTLDVTIPGSTVSYTWQDNSHSPVYTASTSGLYWVELSQGTCYKRDSIYLTFNDVPVFNLGPDQSLCSDESVLLNANYPNATYTWQDNSKNPWFNVTTSGWYSVIVNVNNCTATDSVYIDYANPNCLCSLVVPNAFSPNGDGLNDALRLITKNDIILKDFKIYNRWGNEVFSTKKIDESWDGKFQGANAENDTYFFYLKYQCTNNKKEYFVKGDITLVR